MAELTPPEQRIEYEMCKRSAHTFIFGMDVKEGWRHFLYTKDEHNIYNPKQPFPDLPYLRCMIDMFLVGGRIIEPEDAHYALSWGLDKDHLRALYDTSIIAVEKSRQVMITWVALAYILWRAKFMEHQLILVQSKREADAQKLVCVKESEPDAARLTFMETHLPPHLRSVDFSRRGATAKCNVYFDSGSHVWGIPEGGSIIRSHTPSLLFSDEAAFQPAFGEAYRAALPAIRGGGQAIFVSSAEVGEFQQLLEADR